MAAGDLTKSDDHFGTLKVIHGTIEGPASYATGGIVLTTAKFGLTSVDFVLFPAVKQDADEAMIARYDAATDKVQIYNCLTADALQEIANATNIAAFEIRFVAFGH